MQSFLISSQLTMIFDGGMSFSEMIKSKIQTIKIT